MTPSFLLDIRNDCELRITSRTCPWPFWAAKWTAVNPAYKIKSHNIFFSFPQTSQTIPTSKRYLKGYFSFFPDLVFVSTGSSSADKSFYNFRMSSFRCQLEWRGFSDSISRRNDALPVELHKLFNHFYGTLHRRYVSACVAILK